MNKFRSPGTDHRNPLHLNNGIGLKRLAISLNPDSAPGTRIKPTKRVCLITFLAIALLFSGTYIPFARKIAGAVAANVSPSQRGGSRRLMSTLSPSVVIVSGRQLIVRKRNTDGTLGAPAPYGIRGVNWSPARRQTNTDPNDPNNVEVRRQEFQLAAPTDIPLIKNMNVNTVRTYMDPPLDANGLAVLDQLYDNGIMVVMTVDNGSRDITRVQQAVSFYKDHPAILMWSIGNEWNINPSIPICQIADQIQQEAALIKSLDSNHPVATSYGEIDIANQVGATLADTLNYVNNKCPSVDVWALNIFRGNTFGTLFEQWALMTSKPMMIGEFGTDAFRLYSLGNQPPGVEDGTMQAQWDLSEWNHLFKNLSANNPAKVAIGGFVFEWNDEWWKVPMSVGVHDPDGCGPPNCPNHPDSFANEEYFGIVTIDDHQPRAIYNTLTTAFHSAYQPQNLTYRATSRGSAFQETPFQNGVTRLYKEGAVFYERTGGAGGGRGFNIAAFNPCTGELLQPTQNFDTWNSTHNGNGSKFCDMSNFLDSLPTGTLVMISVADEAGLNDFPPSHGCNPPNPTNSCIGPFVQKLTQEYHSTMITQYCYWNSWAMISVKGESAARSEQLSSTGEASAQATLPILTSLSPTSQSFAPGAGNGSISVSVSSGCNWIASSSDNWIMLQTGAGTGSGTLNYSVAANPGSTLRAGTITVAGQTCVVSQAGTPINVQATVQTSPSGRSFTVDGSTFTTPQTLTWPSGSCHTISTTTPQSGAGGTQYVWSNWSDGGAISHEVSPSGNATYTANFVTSPPPNRTLTVASSNPSSGVSITVSPNDNNGQGNGVTQFTRTYNDSAVVNLTAPSSAGGNTFQKWQRDGADFAVTTATNVTMDANHTMTAVYVTTPPTRTLTVASSNPSSGVSITVSPNDNNAQGNGVTQFNRVYNNNVIVTLVAPSTAAGNTFQKWQRDSVDFAVTASTNVTMDANHTMTAVYATTGQTLLLDETFSAGIPAAWSVVNGGSGGGTAATWTTANPGSRTMGGALFTAPFAIIDSDFAGQAATQDEQLITPALNASSCTGRVVVEFGNQFQWYDQGQSEVADLDVSTNGGSTWINVHRMQGSDNGYPIAVRKTIDITAAIGSNRSNVKVRFHYYNASFEWWWAIDNVKVKCINGPPHNGSTTGIFRPTNGALYLKNSNSTGFADLVLTYGSAGDYPVAGDWNGDGVDTIGVYRNGTFYLRNSNTVGFADIVVQYGQAGDQPVVGDWDGDGVDTIGVFRNGTFLLRNSNTPGPADITFGLGGPGDVGIAGDWDGDGIDTTGVYRPSNGALYLKFSNTTGFADLVLTYGSPGDKPVVGDWDGDGIDTIGIYRVDTFFLRNTNTNGVAQIVFTLGSNGDIPISGDWDGLP